MRSIRDFHHYKHSEMSDDDRLARLERRVVDLLLSSPLTDNQRDSSVAFELKHSSAVIQFARLLARKRGLSEEICSAGAALHDIYVIVKGSYKDHARLGEPIARELLLDVGFRSAEENRNIINLIVNHSDKHICSDDPYIEFGKDVDVLDCFLYPNAVEYYLRNKPLPYMYHYLRRAQHLWPDFGLQLPPFLTFLDSYGSNWLDTKAECNPRSLLSTLTSNAIAHQPPSFLLRIENASPMLYFNNDQMTDFVSRRGIPIDRSAGNETLFEMSHRVTSSLLYEFFAHKGLNLDDCHGIMIWAPIQIYEPIPKTLSGLARLAELSDSLASTTATFV